MGTSMRPYPDGIEWAWLACDREGQLGLFISAGRGPIPTQALDLSYPADIEDQVNALPKMSDAQLQTTPSSPARFTEIAERGVFAFEWRDTTAATAYELIGQPYRPCTLDMLPETLAEIARLVRFPQIAFTDGWRVDVLSHLPCREPA
jgi:hypothetical protein